MNWKTVKIIYQIEKRRCNPTHLSLIFSVITAIFLSLFLFRSMLIDAYSSTLVMKQFLMYMAIFFSISFSLLFIEELKSDYEKGIFHTFLIYPINPGEIILSKLMALGSYVFLIIISIIIVFIFLSEIFLIWGMVWFISFIIGVLLLIFVTYTVSFIMSPLINLSPLPELIIILFFLTITFFSFSLPLKYLALLAPFITIPEIIIGINNSSQIIGFSIGGLFLYIGLFVISYLYLNAKKRRYVP